MRYILFLIFLLEIILHAYTFAAEEQDKYQWEYITSMPPTSYYVDVNPNHIAIPDSDTIVFFIKSYNAKFNKLAAYQVAVKVIELERDDFNVKARYEKIFVYDSETEKTIYSETTPTEWISIPVDSVIYAAFVRIVQIATESNIIKN